MIFPYHKQATRCLLIAIVILSGSIAILHADAPAMINYQGKLADASGNPQTNIFPMIFRIYDASSGGNLLVSDDRSINRVPVTNGIFNVIIGSGTIVAGTKTSIAAAIQSTPNTYLEVSVNGTNLSPRQRLVATPYALSVAPGSVGSAEVSAVSASKISAGTFQAGNYSFAGSVLTVPTPSNPTDVANKSYVDSQSASGGQWTTNGSSIGYTSGYVGIGTTSPTNIMEIKDPTTNGLGVRISDNGSPRLQFNNSGIAGGVWQILNGENGNNDLSFSSGTSGTFGRGASILYLSNSGNVGIGTTTPGTKLAVIGSVALGGDDVPNSGNSITMTGGSNFFGCCGAGGNIFLNPGDGIIPGSIALANVRGKVGVGTSTPSQKLDVNGAAKMGGLVQNAGTFGAYVISQNLVLDAGSPGTGSLFVAEGGSNFGIYQYGSSAINYFSGQLGIGTPTPGAKLEVRGNVKIVDGTQSAGDVLTSDANGLASWQAPSGVPTGTIVIYAGNTDVGPPSGWLLCDGSAVSRTTYATLYAALGAVFGAGDGSSTFNLPDLRGRFALGDDTMGGIAAGRVAAGAGRVVGGGAGEENHTLTIAEMPAHTHGIGTGASNALSCGGCGSGPSASNGVASTSSGGGAPHNNMPPYLTLNYIIKY